MRICSHVACFALSLLVMLSWTVSGGETYLGLLGETVPWHAFDVTTEDPLRLSVLPRETLDYAPAGDDVFYGAIQLGNGADVVLSLAFRTGEIPLLWVDANNNEDLLDDEAAIPDTMLSDRECIWIREVAVSYTIDGVASETPYILQFTAHWSDGAWQLSYGSSCMRMGFVQIGETLHRIYLVESDSDALFTNTWELMVGVDTDGNGMPTLDMASPEWFTRGWPLDFAGFVQISNHYYCVVDVSPDGRSIELAGFESSLTPLPTLLPGYSAPSFTALTAAGDPFTVGDPFESPVLLLFAPIAQLFPETFDPCADRGWLGSVACIEGYFRPVSGAFRELARTQAVLTYAEELQAAYDLEIVLVATDINWLSENDRNVAAALDLPISLLWDEAPMNRYRTTYYNAILIDDRGLIVARDSVIPRYDESGHLLESESDVLTLLEIGEFLESMAGREDP